MKVKMTFFFFFRKGKIKKFLTTESSVGRTRPKDRRLWSYSIGHGVTGVGSIIYL